MATHLVLWTALWTFYLLTEKASIWIQQKDFIFKEKQQLAINLMVNTLSVLTKYSKPLPVRKDIDKTSPPYTYTFPHYSISHPLPLPIPPPPSY